MTISDNPDTAAIELALWEVFLADRARGAVRPVAEYQARFPGYETFVAQRLDELGDASIVVESVGSVRDGTAVTQRADSVALWRGERPVAATAAAAASGRYVLANEIGRGGMGEVVRAWDCQLHRSVALKRLTRGAPGVAGPLGRFLDEAQVTGQLQHPGIVPVHDVGIDERGRAYFTMSLVRGRSFDAILELVQRGAEGWNRTRALTSLLRACEAVAYAHSHGVVHRDLKPSNIMIGGFGETYVMDWGVAHIPGRDENGDAGTAADGGRDDGGPALRTVEGEVLGTPAYMAPEQADGRLAEVGPRSDVYSLGAVLYHLLSGRVPYSDAPKVPGERTIDRVRRGPPSPLPPLARDAAPELIAICERAMARRPEARYADVEEFAEDLRSFLEMRVVRAYRTGAFAELRKWIARNRGLATACAVAAFALVLGLASSLVFGARARRAAEHAEANFSLAFEAVDRLLSQVGTGKLASVPQAQAARREILGDAVAILQEFLATRSEDPRVRAELGRAWTRLGKIHLLLGEEDATRRAYEESIAVLSQLAIDEPQRVDVMGHLVEARSAYAAWVGSREHHVEARAQFESIRALVETMVAREPEVAAHRAKLALVLRNLATAMSKQGEFEAANQLRRAGITTLHALCDRFPDELVHLWRLMQDYGEFAYALFMQRRIADADEMFTNGLRALDDLLARAPGEREFREGAADFLGHLSVYEMQVERHVQALSTLTRCETLNHGLVEDYPDVPAYHGRLGANVSNIGQTLAKLGWPAEGRKRLEEAIVHERRAVEGAPDEILWPRYLRNQYGHLVRLSRELDEPEVAARWAAELAELQAAGKAAR
ncbi:MAG: serine/threonine protein kinase [Planctomycetes bacterium]|nr:serine/threonine protein kinase [Planctomycetota bacterium]